MTLALFGFSMVGVFMALILTKRLSAVAALILVPLIFGVIAGFAPDLGGMIIKGVIQVAPTALMLVFAILYFGIMIDAGLFDPLVNLVLKLVGTDPIRIAVGTVILATVVSLDGDAVTTALVTTSALLPVYRRIGMRTLTLGALLLMSNSVMNLLPWGGPAARVTSALHLDISQVFLPLIPVMLVGVVATLGFAVMLGRAERKRLAGREPVLSDGPTGPVVAEGSPRPERRPRLILVNLALTLALVAGLATGIAPLPVVMMVAFALAVTINYPRLSEQRERVSSHADNIANIVALILSAGAFTGILNGTGMVDAMAHALISVIPPSVGPYMAPITALASMPLTFFMSNDAYYFGIVPVVAQTAAGFGIDPAAIARASLMGGAVHYMSPLVAGLYLLAALLEVEMADMQKFILPKAIGLCLIMIVGGLLFGAFPLVAAAL
ncbi:MAG: citrate transporter [Caulobacteraceae bacterium]|nr:citrate transporter [Caulobacteraceae bacterium]